MPTRCAPRARTVRSSCRMRADVASCGRRVGGPARSAWRQVFDLMWEAYLSGTIPVGAVVVDGAGEILGRGRNRIFDATTDSQLGHSRLAHAEINALVGLPSDRTHENLTLYTALEPCHLCLSAATAVRG